MKFVNPFKRSNEEAITTPVPSGEVNRSWTKAKGDDSIVCRFDHNGHGYVFKLPRTNRTDQEIELEKELARKVGAPTTFGEVETKDGSRYPASLSHQVLLVDEISYKASKNSQIPEDEKVEIITKIMTEKVKAFLYTLQMGILADFDHINVGIGEVRTGSNNPEAAVYLVDFAGAIKIGNSKDFIRALKSLTDSEKLEFKNSFSPERRFMTHSPFCIYLTIKQQDLDFADSLQLPPESKEIIKKAIEAAYKMYEEMIKKGRKLPLPKAALTEKTLTLDPLDYYQISEKVQQSLPQFDIKTLSFD